MDTITVRGQRELEKGETEGGEKITELNEWTWGGPGRLTNRRWPSVLHLGPQAGWNGHPLPTPPSPQAASF